MLTYEFYGETLLANFDRECGHPYLQEGGDCEVCDIDWLIESGEAPPAGSVEAQEMRGYREGAVASLISVNGWKGEKA